jgi:hypothetical protein
MVQTQTHSNVEAASSVEVVWQEDFGFSSRLNENKYHAFVPLTLSIVKHVDQQLMGFIEYSSSIYGLVINRYYGVIHFIECDQEWGFAPSQLNADQSPSFERFLARIHTCLTQKLQIDLSLCKEQLGEFEKKEIIFKSLPQSDTFRSGSVAARD